MIEKISVIGSGIMGSGIAQVAAMAGYQVTMRDIDNKYLERGFGAIRKSLERMKTAGKITEEELTNILSRISGDVELEKATEHASLIIEAIPENLELKKQLFQELDNVSPVDAVLATNTSSFSITAIAAATRNPARVIGMHFSNPVPVMAIVELIKGRETSEKALEVAKGVCKKMGKDIAVVGDFPGFAGNRLLPLFMNEAFYVLWEGIASAEDIDKLCRLALRHPMGPLELADLTGLDTVLSILEYLHKEIGEKYRPCPLLKQYVAAGHYGRKTGRGVYKYT